MLMIGVEARCALCRLARALPRPGARWRGVTARRAAMRAWPSAAPVTTPSNRPSTQRIPSTRSSAATKCISDVPGLLKHTSTPPATSVRTRLSAPFTMNPPLFAGSGQFVAEPDGVVLQALQQHRQTAASQHPFQAMIAILPPVFPALQSSAGVRKSLEECARRRDDRDDACALSRVLEPLRQPASRGRSEAAASRILD